MKKAPAALLSALAITASGQAAVLANYDFQVAGGSAANTVSTASTVSSSSYTASALSGGDGLKGSIPPAGAITATSTTGATNTQHLVVRVSGTDAVDENDKAGAIAANDYYAFTVTPNAGISLTYTSLTFDLARSGSFTGTLFIRSSLDNYATDLYSVTPSTNTTTLSAQVPLIFDSSFANLDDAVTFRFFFADNSSSVTTSVVYRLDNFVLNGEVIPEPGSALLLGFGTLGLISRRRR